MQTRPKRLNILYSPLFVPRFTQLFIYCHVNRDMAQNAENILIILMAGSHLFKIKLTFED